MKWVGVGLMIQAHHIFESKYAPADLEEIGNQYKHLNQGEQKLQKFEDFFMGTLEHRTLNLKPCPSRFNEAWAFDLFLQTYHSNDTTGCGPPLIASIGISRHIIRRVVEAQHLAVKKKWMLSWSCMDV